MNWFFHRRDFTPQLLWLPLGGFLAVFLALCMDAPAAAATPAAGEPRLLILGDSLSAEYGLERGQGWVHLLEQRLQKEERKVQVINASISGETTAGGLSRLPALLKTHTPAYVVIELGGNDALRGMPLAGTRENLRAMVEAARKEGARVLLLGMQVPPNYGTKYSQDFADLFGSVAREENVALVPFMLEDIARPADMARYFQPDRIHPNAAAQPLILQTVWPQIDKLLQQGSRKPA